MGNCSSTSGSDGFVPHNNENSDLEESTKNYIQELIHKGLYDGGNISDITRQIINLKKWSDVAIENFRFTDPEKPGTNFSILGYIAENITDYNQESCIEMLTKLLEYNKDNKDNDNSKFSVMNARTTTSKDSAKVRLLLRDLLAEKSVTPGSPSSSNASAFTLFGLLGTCENMEKCRVIAS